MNGPELTHLIKARQIPAEPVVIEPNKDECRKLAGRFGLSSIERMIAKIALEADGKAVRARGQLNAQITQICAISGEDFPVTISETIDLRFVHESTVPQALAESEEIEIELAADDCDEIEYSGEAFDLGEAIAQSLGLAIDPYAEGPNADAAREKAGIIAEGNEDGPLAEMLKGLDKG
ncbi:MAG: DUF177 domain-containing protein [Pseudomonadota bacterium]